MYYILDCPVYTNENGELLVQIENDDEVGEVWSWMSGVVFDEDEKKSIPNPINMEVNFYQGYTGLPTELLDVGTCVMSERLANAIQSVGTDNVDFYPVILTHKETGTTYKYFAYNIIGKVSAVDFEASELTSYDNNVIADASIHDLVLDESKIKNQLIFRLAENVGTTIVHESIKSAVEELGIDTVKFIKPEDYMHL